MCIECLPRGELLFASLQSIHQRALCFFHRKLSCSSPFISTCSYTPISAPPTNRCSFVKIAWAYTVLPTNDGVQLIAQNLFTLHSLLRKP
jgi:hypothetical protein